MNEHASTNNPGIAPPNVQPQTAQPSESVAAPSATPPSPIHKIFVGPGGIRPVWRIFLYILLVFAFAFAAVQVRRALGIKFSNLGEMNSPVFIIATRTESFLAMLLA